MHAIHFNIRLRKPTSVEAILARLKQDDRMALTYKQSAIRSPSVGTTDTTGRILNQGVLVVPTLTVHKGRRCGLLLHRRRTATH